MKWLIRYVTRRPRGQEVFRDEQVEALQLGIGRGTDNAVHVPDLRLGFRHAVLRPAPGGAVIEAEGDADLRIGPRSVRSAELRPGDSASVGPVQLTLLPAGDGHDLGVAVEVVVPQVDDDARIRAVAAVGLGRALPGKRTMSWALAGLVALTFLLLPMLVGLFGATPHVGRPDGMDLVAVQGMHRELPLDTVWDTGTLSAPHRFLSGDCRVCHEKPFVMVRDETCASCHRAITHHADIRIPVGADLAETRCAHCHKEHNGPHPAVESDQAMCTGCHAGLKAEVGTTTLQDVRDFAPGSHPQFSPTVVTDGTTGKTERIALGGAAPPIERSNLAFPHDKHLALAGKRTPDGVRPITCATCHESDAGPSFRPVDMETHCGSCHTLKFDPRDPSRTVPHGTVAETAAVVRDHFRAIVLAGDYDEVTAPAVVRRKPGTPLQPEERAAGMEWADLKTAEALQRLTGAKGCGACHTMRPSDDPLGVTVAPVRVTQRWMPKGIFDHSRHTETGCTSCHAAKASHASSDVLLPGIETCFACHGTQDAADKVPSACVSCHVFHRDGLPPLRPASVTEAKAP